MKLEDCYKRIDKYMQSSDRYPRLVNINNSDDMNSICTHYSVGTNIVKSASEFAEYDELVSEPKIINYLSKGTGCIFIKGITTFYKLLGSEKLKNFLEKIVSKTFKAKIIIFCYQCSKELNFSDIRSKERIYFVDGVTDAKPELVLSTTGFSTNHDMIVDGINNISDYIEFNNVLRISVKTKKKKANYPYSMIEILEQGNTYQQLCNLDSSFSIIDESCGSVEQWNYTFETIKNKKSFGLYIDEQFVSTKSLELSFQKWCKLNDNERWMYFLALKCYGCHKNEYLEMAVKVSNTPNDVIKNIYNVLLNISHTDENFWNMYEKRNELINLIGEHPVHFVTDYCDWTLSKQKDAIYYLTSNTEFEIHLIFKLLNDYHEDINKDELTSILKHVYPALYEYLKPYNYKNELLNKYFNDYKYLKALNYISPEFMNLVEEQAIKREYNAILPARWEKTEGIANKNTIIYFIDAMGVEYISFLLNQCQKNNLLAYVTLCHSEIPSITKENKEFIDVFVKDGATLANGNNGYKKLDELKHHGEESFSDYTREKLPIHLAEELKLLSELIRNVAKDLQNGNYDKVVLISDHGASRLAVIKEQELQHEMKTKGIHSGRCCPKVETDVQPECSTESDKYWVIANYGRFKGGRAANVEVHGGATLEEVVVPIIEITKKATKYQFEVLTPDIKFSKRKKDAKVKIFSKNKLRNISIKVSGIDKIIDVISTDEHTFTINIPELQIKGNYSLSVYLDDNLLAEGLNFTATNQDFIVKDIL